MDRVIKAGPFTGVTVQEEDLIFLPGESGMAIEWWPAHVRTPLFLDRFPPQDGWTIEIGAERGPFDLPDYRTPTLGAEGPVVQPTQLFTAALKRAGQVVNQASSLEIIDGPKAWERGETNARGRLYDALGLPGAVRMSQTQAQETTQAKSVEIKPVAVGETTTETPKIDANLLRQIETLAGIHGVNVPTFGSRREATEFFKALVAKTEKEGSPS